jgi:hypothetical protein
VVGRLLRADRTPARVDEAAVERLAA